ncbi:hypothetical protein KSF_066740 [Reticulibacter mediterranei]|uniref:Uncharacterized protein n=1 Tax=Reticulibacter mediterranei TaxID=2778369 RepID=A0A8J3ILB8_9CHLR|nr:hypothetical protein [Reticulibacter mediterranei]GHO96626.1 hypothetical protein KSF_066740 [Reticulibacter mediterranei]
MQELCLEQQNTSNQPLTHLTESIPAVSHIAPFEQKLLECYAERIALSVRRATNFTQSLLQQHLAPDITLLNRRGQPLILHGKDICNEGTWRKFLTAATLATPQLCSLVEGTETITRRYRSWLLTSYTQRYKNLVQPAHLTWFHHVTRLAVIWHIMEAKAQHSAFVDPWVAQEMEALEALGTLATEVAKAIHHIVKEPKEEAPRLLEHLYLVHAAEMTRPHLAPQPLPALPEGMHPPLALLPKGEQEQMGLPEETAQ